MSWSRQFSGKADPRHLPELRHEVEGYLEGQGLSENLVNTAALLISELTHNAVEASDGGKEVLVSVAQVANGIRLEVECDANHDLEGLNTALEHSGQLPSPDSERGRGLWLVLTMSDQLEVKRGEGGAVRVSLVVAGA